MSFAICHITSMHDWDDDRIFQRACIGIANSGYSITLIATDPPSDIVEGVQMFALKKRSGFRRRVLSSIDAYRLANALKVDIYHFHDPDLLPWMLILAKKGRKVIYDVHENYAERLQNASIPSVIKPLAVKLWMLFERYCVRSFAGVITTTPSMQQLFEGINTPKLSVSNTPYLKALEDVELTEEKEPFTIYTSGSHSSKRNCVQTVEALPRIIEAIPEARMIFVGRYVPETFEQELVNRARELGVAEHLETYGMLPWKENFKRTASMEVGCVFYEDNLNNRVTLPNRLFEYMYAGVAVIGENFPEVHQVVNEADCGLCVDSSKPDSIADGVIELFNNKKKLRVKQQNGKEAIQNKYAFDFALKEMIEFYKIVIKHVI